MKDRKRGKWTEPPRPVGTKTKVWMIAWEETWERWKEDRAKNYLEKYLAIETKTWFKKKKKTPTRRNMRTSTPGAKGYLETLQKTKDHERCFDLCQGLVSPQLSWTFCHCLQMLELQPLPLHLPGTMEVYAWCETLKACPKEIPEWQVFHQNCGGQKEVALHFASVLFIFFF